jgi:hypothetical protein
VLVKLQETCRLAVVDLDWSTVTAVDILAVMRSFVMAGGGIGAGVTRVTVYPSDYGLEKMAEEAVAGPQVGFGSLGGGWRSWGVVGQGLLLASTTDGKVVNDCNNIAAFVRCNLWIHYLKSSLAQLSSADVSVSLFF